MKFALGIIGCGVMANAILDGILNKSLFRPIELPHMT